MIFNATYAGHVFQMENGEVYTINSSGQFAYTGAQLDGQQTSRIVTVILTGYSTVTPKGNTACQTTSGGYIFLKDGWQDKGTSYVSRYSQSQAQKLVNTIIKNNKIIIQNNILCARFANKLDAEQKQTLYNLQLRLQARNSALINQGVCANVQTSYPKGYADMEAYLDNFMKNGGVGISTLVVIVVSAIVIASLSTAAYFAYKSFANESERDVKYSRELTKVLTSKLTEDEYQQLLAETKGIVTRARIKQSLSSTGSLLMVGLAAIGGYFIYQYLKK